MVLDGIDPETLAQELAAIENLSDEEIEWQIEAAFAKLKWLPEEN